MRRIAIGGLVLLALVLVIVPAAVVNPLAVLVPVLLGLAAVNLHLFWAGRFARRGFSWRRFWASELGAVTVTYFARSGVPGGTVLINGSTTAPTAIQASQIAVLKVIVNFGADSDVQALITHNWGLDKSGPTYFDPQIFLMGLVNSIGVNNSYQASFSMDFTNTNVLKINKQNFVGTNGQYLFCLRNQGGEIGNAGVQG